MLTALVAFLAAPLAGFVAVYRLRRAAPEKRALVARVAALPPIAKAAIGEAAKVDGAVSLVDAGIEGPVIEQTGVWIELEVLADELHPDSAMPCLSRIRDAVPFSLEGVRVHPPDRAMTWPLVQLVRQRDTEPMATPTPRIRAFLAARGVDVDAYCAPGRKLVFRERCLLPGTALVAIGTRKRPTTPAQPTGYRDAEAAPPELSASELLPSERAITRDAEPDPLSWLHAVVFVLTFVVTLSTVGALGYAMVR